MMAIYATDYSDMYPIAGGVSTPDTWASSGIQVGWAIPSTDFDLPANSAMAVGSSLYLLVREVDGDPGIFVCKSSSETVFQNKTGWSITELWNFGVTRDHVSYAYQMPYEANGQSYPADGSADSSFAVLADKNPWLTPELLDASVGGAPSATDYENKVDRLNKDWGPTNPPSNKSWQEKIANSNSHSRDGQNVLFGDGHADFMKRPDVGKNDDNIYILDNGGEDNRRGGPGIRDCGTGRPQHGNDSFLVQDDGSNI